MNSRPSARFIRRSMLGSGLIAVAGLSALDVTKKWPATADPIALDPIGLIRTIAQIIHSSPLLTAVAVGLIILLIIFVLRLLIGPNGLQTPE